MTMTEAPPVEPAQARRHSIGARRLSRKMLDVRDRADRFAGLPAGSAKPLRILAAFEEAAPYLGLPVRAPMMISWLIRMTRPEDWEDGSRPIAWPSARRQAEYLGIGPTQVRELNRDLFEAGLIVMRDDEQGKRHGRRGPDGRIIEAFGFDLSPLAQRYDEFVAIAAAARLERDRMRALRRRITLARRCVRQVGEALAEHGAARARWPSIMVETADIARAARAAERSEDLAFRVAALERLKCEAEQILRDEIPVETVASGTAIRCHITDTNRDEDPSETVAAREDRGAATPGKIPPSPPPGPTTAAEPREKPELRTASRSTQARSRAMALAPTATDPIIATQELRLKPAELLELAPRLKRYVVSRGPHWPAIVEAASTWLRPELGVSATLWGEACVTMGREGAAVALAVVSTKPVGHITRSAGGYFAGMVRKAARSELRLEQSIWALRKAKWGMAERRQMP